MEFEGVMYLKEKWMDEIAKVSAELCKKAIRECGSLYQFDAEEAIDLLKLNPLRVKKEEMKKKEKPVKASFPLPYNGEYKKECCEGLKQNHGLYTQCTNLKKEGNFCSCCKVECEKNEDGKPDYGTIQDRMAVGIMEYCDRKGKSPMSYIKFMKKRKLTKEHVLEEAAKWNVSIHEVHFEESISSEGKRGRPKIMSNKVEEEDKKKKGRPKKSKKVVEVAGESHDLFAELVEAAMKDPVPVKEVPVPVKEVPVPVNDPVPVKEVPVPVNDPVPVNEVPVPVNDPVPEKEPKALDKKAEKAATLKAEKEAKAATLKAEKEAKAAALKAEKEAKAAALKAEKDTKAAALKAEKEAKALEKKEVSESSEEEVDVVKKFEFKGVKYLKSKKTGIIYNMEQEVVGKWNEETQNIDLEEHDDELEEEE
jgi:hypothetical protein